MEECPPILDSSRRPRPNAYLILSQAEEHSPKGDVTLPLTLQECLVATGGVERVRAYLEMAARRPDVSKLAIPEGKVRIARPFLPGNVICVGLNYREHVREGGAEVPQRPLLFAKFDDGCDWSR